MEKHRQEFGMNAMARVLCVTRSGYYFWLKNRDQQSSKRMKKIELDRLVMQSFIDSKQRYGAERIQKDLADLDVYPDIKTIRSSIKRQGLQAKAARLFKVTTNSNHQHDISPNLLERNFKAEKPNQKWAGDISYLYTSEGWLYLAVIIDLYSRAVVGWSVSERMTSALVCDALNMGLWRRGMPKDVIVHSDRGSQYCSKDYRKIIKENDLSQSMSRKADCWDNACSESFFHSLKVEAIYGEPILNREEMRALIFEYIEIDYNKTRRHSTIGFLSPEQFERKNA